MNARPVTPYQWYLVEVCGHILRREGLVFVLEAAPSRIEYTPGGIGHIPYGDEDAAEAFEKQFGPAYCYPHPCPRAYGVRDFLSIARSLSLLDTHDLGPGGSFPS